MHRRPRRSRTQLRRANSLPHGPVAQTDRAAVSEVSTGKLSPPAEVAVTQSPACGCRRERGFVMWSRVDRNGLWRTLNRRPIGDQRAVQVSGLDLTPSSISRRAWTTEVGRAAKGSSARVSGAVCGKASAGPWASVAAGGRGGRPVADRGSGEASAGARARTDVGLASWCLGVPTLLVLFLISLGAGVLRVTCLPWLSGAVPALLGRR
jgi:hypothetical protein